VLRKGNCKHGQAQGVNPQGRVCSLKSQCEELTSILQDRSR